MKKFFHDVSICVMCGIMIVGLIGLPSIIRSLSLSSSSSPNPNFYQPVFAQPAAQGNRPNFLVIVGDDFGWSDIGPFGSEINTPNLNALAKDGKILTNYHTAPTCSPGRLSLLTGVDYHIGGIGTMFELIAPNQVGKPGYETYINNRVVTVAELLKDAGYNTILSGKWHLSGQGVQPGTLPFDRGFDHSLTLVEDGAQHFSSGEYIPGWTVKFAENGKLVPRPGNNTLYDADMFTDKLLDYLKQTQSNGKPFFAYLASQVAHTPFQAPPENIEKYYKMYSSMGWDKIREQRFEKQKELGIWPSNTPISPRLPPIQAWDSLSKVQQNYAAKVLAVHSAMIENLDQNIGRVIQYLKDTGQYDNTFIIFTSDNGTSEPFEILDFKYASGVDLKAGKQFIARVNNSLQNLGNPSSDFNYGAWGSYVAATPFSGYKTSFYEGGVRGPVVIKEPKSMSSSPSPSSSSAPASNNIVKGLALVTDITPTILQMANVSHPSTYKGHAVHPLMGKSIKPLLDGTADKVYADDEPISGELFNETSVRIGDWVGIHDASDANGVWKLFNTASDLGQNNNVAAQHPDIVQKMKADYDKFAQDVGVVIPRGAHFAQAVSKDLPPIAAGKENTVTINLGNMLVSGHNATQPTKDAHPGI